MSRTAKPNAAPSPHRWRSGRNWRRLTRTSAAWMIVVAVAAPVAVVSVGDRKIGLALAALVLVVGLLVADPLLLVVIALPGALLIQRVGGGTTNLSAADLLVFVGAVVALFHIHWKEAPHLREFIRGIVWFQAVLILIVVAHPFRADVVEWLHRWSYLAGSVLVGWVIATHGRARQAFRLFLAGSSLLALIAMEHAVAGHFKPAQWGVYQKNAIGGVLLIAILIAQINPPWAGLGRLEVTVSKYLCIGGLLASQSRQWVILLILALAVSYCLNPDLRGRSKLLLVGAIPLIVVLYYSFTISARNNPKFNSVSIRVDQIGAAIHAWHLSPILGQGMRFYNLPQFITVTAPPNVFIDNLASTGVIGSLAFVFMVFITMRAMIRLPYVVGTLGLVVLLSHYVDGLFDIFWIGASSIAPFIIAGISLGMADLDRTGDRPREPVAGSISRSTSATGLGRTGPPRAGPQSGPEGRSGRRTSGVARTMARMLPAR
jgi:hypothetical protein